MGGWARGEDLHGFIARGGEWGGETSVLPLILLSRPSMQARSSAGLGSQDHKLYLHLSELQSYILHLILEGTSGGTERLFFPSHMLQNSSLNIMN